MIMPLNCTFKIVKMAKLVIHILPQVFKEAYGKPEGNH